MDNVDHGARLHGFTLEEHATLSAWLAEGTPLAELLAQRSVTEELWNAATLAWTEAMAVDVRTHGTDARLPILYSEAFAAAQSSIRPVPELTPDDWARLQHRLETGNREEVLAESGLRLADYVRLVRVWTRRLAEDPAASARCSRVLDGLRHRR